MAKQSFSASHGSSLHVDEIGLESCFLGAYQLKSLYQPIFRIVSDSLVPEAVEASILSLVDFEPVDRGVIDAALEPEGQGTLNSLANLMHIGNFHHIGEDDMSLHLPFEPALQCGARAVEHLALTFARFAQSGLPPQSVMCCLWHVGNEGPAVSGDVLDTMRLGGVRIALDDFGPCSGALATVDRIQPDMVKFDGSWFRRVADSVPALRLMRQLVEGLKRSSAEVLIKGLESPAELLAAMSVGADLVQGDLLARPGQAGFAFDIRPLDIERIFRDPRKVIVSLQ